MLSIYILRLLVHCITDANNDANCKVIETFIVQ